MATHDIKLKKYVAGVGWEDAYPETTHTQIIAAGTPSITTYLRGDGTWSTIDEGGASVTVSSTPPASPSQGDLWFEDTTGSLYIYYEDDSSAQWIEISSAEFMGVAQDFIDHIANISNPHQVTATQVGAYTTSETDTAIANAIAAIIDTSPETLDTLNELAAAINDDPLFFQTIQNAIDGKADLNHTHTASDIDSETALDGYVLMADGLGGAAWEEVAPGVSKEDLQNVYIYGKASGAITIGQAVQFAGVQGDHILMKAAVPSEINAEPTLIIGIAETTLANNEFGYAIVNGRLNLDTSAYEAGDLLYFASAGSTAGALTTTEPTDPNASIQMAAVSIDGVGNGEFIVRTTILTRKIDEIIGLQGALDSKVNKSGDTMTGTLTMENNSKIEFPNSFSDQKSSINTSSLIFDLSSDGMFGDYWGGLALNNAELQMISGSSIRLYTSLYTNQLFLGHLDGNVGIGTGTPDEQLSVSGNISVTGTVDGVDVATLKSDYDTHAGSTDNPHSVTKTQVGLGNVTNDAQIPLTQKGTALGVAELDANGLVLSSQLPSFVDDVLEYANLAGFPATGESGKIYIAQDNNLTYRWSGSGYTEISSSLALGETSSTAYRGDRGKIAYDHSQLTSGNPHGVTASDVGAVALTGDTMTGDLTIDKTAPKIFMADDVLTLGLSSEVNGQLINYGTNYDQLGLRDAAYPGSFFRIDVRDAAASEMFNVKYIPPNSTEQTVFKVSRTGDVVASGGLTTVGNVGIGTTSPGYNLDVYKNSSDVNPTFRLQNAGTNAGSGINLSGNNNAANSLIWHNGAVNALMFQTNTATYDANKIAMTIDSSQNVGIGTTSPGHKLDVIGDLRVTGGIDNESAVGGNSHIGLDVGSNTFNNYFSTTTNGSTFFRSFNGSYTIHSVLTGAGNLGLGTTSLTGKLDVLGSGQDILKLRHDAGSGGNWAINPYIVGINNAGLSFIDRKNSTTPFVISDGGNVGIGTTEPGYKLQVDGDLGVTSPLYTHDLRLSHQLDYINDENHSHIWITGGGTSTNPQFTGQGAHLVLEARKNSARHIWFKVGDTTTAQHIMHGNGNVGIGTTSPSTILSVNQPLADINNGLWVYAGDNPSDGGVAIYKSASKVASIASLGGDSSLTFVTNAGGTNFERMRINADGNVNVSQRLTLNREIRHWDSGVRYMNTDPRWSGDTGRLHIWATTGAGAEYGAAGINLYDGDSYHSIDAIANRIQINEFSSAKATLGTRTNTTAYGGNEGGLTINSVAELRGPSTGAAPALTFHYENLATRHLIMESDGDINFVSPSSENSGVAIVKVNGNTVWHAGNDGSGSGLDADLLDGYHISNVLSIQGPSDYVNGTLVTTNMDYSQFSGDSFQVEIEGKSYGQQYPWMVRAQGYIYNNTIINQGIVDYTGNFPCEDLRAFNSNGVLCFWWPRQSYWNNFTVKVYGSGGGLPYNRAVSVTDVVIPAGRTREVSFPVRRAITNANIGSQSVNYAGSAGSATFATNSSKLYSTDSTYQYGSANPYYGYLTYNAPVNRWRFEVSPATPSAVEVSYADNAGTAGTAEDFRAWKWRWIRYANLVVPANGSGGAMEDWFKTYFLKTSEAPADSGYLDTRTQVGDEGGFGGSTYGNMFGDLSNYHAHIYTQIYVDRQFSISVTNFSGDDPHAIFIDEKFVQGNAACCSDISYSYTFTRGWHKIDLIYSEGGGGDWVRMGWNPKNYTSYITDMNPYKGIERTLEGQLTIDAITSIKGSNPLYFGQSTNTLNSWTTRILASGSTQLFNAQSFVFNNDGYGSTWSATIDSSGMAFGGNGRTLYGPNSTWSAYLSVGGNGYNGNATTGSMAITNGNLHLDAAAGGYATYLNFYAGTGGTMFGGGGQNIVAVMGPDGDLWKGSLDNTGVKYVVQTDYASATTGGTVKMRVDGTTLYIRNDGTNA